ncbi:hypothetical protein BDW02DRAFT_570259 [Decorospora gaudefroyi]|uniref:CBF1-interacting co-repressor CIR N-terminal domain-containing protein n=1 Tax=Decorospora gaudefroyi TaxID=184978 RepID=A0A6A5KIC3_9PLEO|nr:hypothetical protein BDW02DRAFT_570259 [Decorospora gaudefroyi]
MPLHLLGKKSWNVYNADNIARVKAAEAAAAAREAADEQRMQELDAARRAALLRGRTPPPLPGEEASKDSGSRRARDLNDRGHDRKRRKLAGEDDTDMDIRLAKSVTAPREDDESNAKVLKLRNTASDAPLTDHAGNIDLFPVDLKQATRREKNAEAEKEKRKKERAVEDQYTMRFSNAAGRSGLQQPWYMTQKQALETVEPSEDLTVSQGFVNTDVWGNEDPRRKEREQARISTNDPFALMQKAQTQLKKAKQDKKQWAEERDRELGELRAAQERDDQRERHRKRQRRDRDDTRHLHSNDPGRDRDALSRQKHRRSRSHSRERREHTSSRRSERRLSRSRDKGRVHDRRPGHHDRRDGERQTSRAR